MYIFYEKKAKPTHDLINNRKPHSKLEALETEKYEVHEKTKKKKKKKNLNLNLNNRCKKKGSRY